jgi:GNAT superfamily N-acetyltransferase
METRIEIVDADQCELVFPFVEKLLRELGEEGDEFGELDVPKVKRAWQEAAGAVAFIAYAGDGEMAGVMTVVESFAIYANGNYGIINEMYVEPKYRSSGIGGQLINTLVSYGASRGWPRIDVTAPEAKRWIRTRRFYEQEGFVFTGPKLKRMI